MTITTKIPKMQNLAKALDKVRELSKDLPTPDYLDGFLNWLEGRSQEWEQTALRVGLVGITSAGKSTFINALAGEDILPRGAQPTSGLLVICRRGENRNMEVSFRDHSKYDFPDDECTPLWVARYASEEENPNNEQNVLELHLTLPGLKIPSKYELIDSPGLDAFGLEGHEELTLRTLVPLVDVVLFLTTTKSTSDKENVKALAKICKESKPVLVVQTHKDAVEPRYMKGGKILETAEQVLEKHYRRVKQLLTQTVILEEAHIVQVSSIDALRARLENPDMPVEKLEAWEESGFSGIVEILDKMHGKVSQEIIIRRFRLLLKEIQKLIDRVKADYFAIRGKSQEAEHYRQMELTRLQELQDSLPAEDSPDFPDTVALQNAVNTVKENFLAVLDQPDDKLLERLPVEVRDSIKALENEYFDKVDKADGKLQEIANELAIDLDSIRPDEQMEKATLPQISRYDKVLEVDAVEQSGLVGRAKRILGKLFQKNEWGYKDQEITEIQVDRQSLKDDLLEYHGIYRGKLANYLRRWASHWGKSLEAIYDALEQRRVDIKKAPLEKEPEPYRLLLGKIRLVRDWIETQLNDNVQKRYTLGFKAIKKTRERRTSVTQRTDAVLKLGLPLLQVSRALNFTRKTHRFWYVVNRLTSKAKKPLVLISTAFSQELINYMGVLGDLPGDEEDILENVLIYSLEDFSADCDIPVKVYSDFPEDSRERWFLSENSILLFHDNLLEQAEGVAAFEKMADRAQAIFRVMDLHQIGHAKKRLSELPIRDKLDEHKNRLGYIGMGTDRLLKSGQTVDAFKSYFGLEKPPGFGLRPILLGDGDDLLNSLLWLGVNLRKGTVADEIEAMEILHRTQERFISGREKFIRNLFQDIKDFRRQQEAQAW